MLKKILLAMTMTAFVAAPAFAFQCPADMATIDAALQSTQLTGADLEKVKELRARGEQEHSAGNHSASVVALAEALDLLGM